MKKRILAWLLIFCLLAVPLVGCGNNEDETTPDQVQAEQPDGVQEASPVSLSDCVYQAEYLDLEVDDSYQFQGVEYCCVSGPYLFFCGKCTPAAEQTAYKEMAIFRMDLDTREIVKLDYLEVPEGSVNNTVPFCMAAGPDGTFWFGAFTAILTFNNATQLYSAISKDESLRQYDADGQLLKTVPTNGLINLSIQQFFLDEAGNFYLNTNDTVYLLDPEGKQLAKLPHESILDTGIYQLSAGEIGLFDSGTFRLIDPDARALGEAVRLPDNASGVYPGNQNYQYFYEITDNLYGYKADTGESDLLLNWVNCGVNRDEVKAVTVLEDGRVAAVIQASILDPCEFVLLTPVDPASAQQQELTLACVMLSSELRSAVTEFNQTHSDVKIVVNDYSQYNTGDDLTTGMTRLFTEILAGQIPDLLCTFNMPVQQLAAQNMLVDLWPLIDSDEELSRDDLMTHLFDLMSIDGKLYQTTSSFYISTTVGNGDVLGNRTNWTVSELMEAVEAMPDESTILGPGWTKVHALLFCFRTGYDAFIDWETQTCHFDSPEFIEILNFANSFPEKNDRTVSGTTYERFQEGRQLLMVDYITFFQMTQVFSALVGGNPCYVGFPSAAGSSSYLGIYGGDVAITAACQNVDAAWSFLRTFLTEEYQYEKYPIHLVGFPSNRHAFEAVVEEEMTEEVLTEEEEEFAVPSPPYSYEGVILQLTTTTQEDYDLFMQLYESCEHLADTDLTISNIVKAEVAPFFAGQKTAEEVAALIQNRVGLYVMEQS